MCTEVAIVMMKMIKILVASIVLTVFGVATSAFAECSVPICGEQGGARMTIGSGGSLDVLSGGEMDVESGGALKIAGTAISASAAQINLVGANPGRGFFTICGDAVTINNNTIYYGPSDTLTANVPGGAACDITAAGNATEATADAPAFGDLGFQVLGMWCRNQADANAAVSFTLRTAAGATVPSVTCSIADNSRNCVADVQTTTAVASGATVAVAAASTSDVGASNGFSCTIAIAY